MAAVNTYSLLFLFLTINLNTCLAVDLVLMIKHPFSRKDDRLSVYLIVSTTIAALLAIANISTA